MERTLVDVLLVSGAISWTTTALVYKTGPFNVFLRIRNFFHRLTQGHSPLSCAHCSSFYVGVLFVSLYWGGTDSIRAGVALIGILGISQALRGQSGEWS
jgi:hypothetical protein